MKYLSILVVAYSAYLLFLDYGPFAVWNSNIVRYYKVLDLMFAFVSSACLVFYFAYKKENLKLKDYVVKIEIFFALVWSGVITGLELSSIGFTTYIVMISVSIFFLYADLKTTIVNLVSSFIAILITIKYINTGNGSLSSAFTIALPILVLSSMIAWKNYKSKVIEWSNNVTLLELNDELFRIKENLEKEVSNRTFEYKEAKLKAEEIQKQLIEAQRISKIWNWEVDLKQNGLTLSQTGYEVFGLIESYSPKELHDKIFNRVYPEDVDKLLQIRKQSVASKTGYQFEYRILVEGNEKTMLQIAKPRINSNNEVIGFYGTSQDITEIKLVQNELLLAKEKAVESENLKTAFLQNMSHEIRTPLNGIIGFSGLLENPDLNREEISEYTSIIKASGERLIEIVNNVLDMSKIETGQFEIFNKQFSLNKILIDLYNFFSIQAEEKKLKLEYQLEFNDMDSFIVADEGKITQVFSNLLKNAIKFTNSGKIVFGYKICGNFVEGFVSDTGIGIPYESKKDVFIRFTQVNSALTNGLEGAGLGLSICKGLVELLGGKIWFESEINRGSQFFFSFPFIHVVMDNTISQQEMNLEHQANKGKILIAEDDWTSYRYLSKLLIKSDYDIIHAENGEQAVDIVKNDDDLCLVLMDIKMPVMNGIQAFELIRELKSGLPVIAQTAYAFQQERDKILSMGFADYISKPIDREELLEIIDKFILKNS